MRSSTLTVYFERPFWVAVLERSEDGQFQAARVVLGAEPTDAELFEILRDQSDRFVFGPALPEPTFGVSTPLRSAKRALREARKDAVRAPGTKAQQALSLAREAFKTEAKVRSRSEREEDEARLRALKELKRKQKHRGH